MYRIGLIGYGGMGSWHAEQIQSMPDFQLAAVYDINPEKVKKARGIGFKGYDTLEEILNDQSIPTVILAVPNNFHKELSITAMEAGKNVICEKPVMMNSADLKDVTEVSKKTADCFPSIKTEDGTKIF